MFATTLIKMCIQKLGVESLNYEPDTIQISFAEEPLIDSDFDKINAISVFLTTTEFQEHWEAFNAICHTLNDIDPNFETLCPLAPQEICWALFELSKNTNEQENFKFSNEVKEYIKKCFEYYGVMFLPTCIKEAIPTFDTTNWNLNIDKETDEAFSQYVQSKWELLKEELLDGNKN